MVSSRPKLHRRALFALDNLLPQEQNQVLTQFERLGHLPLPQWPMHEFRQLPGEENLYLLPIGPDSCVVFRLAAEAQPEVLDIVRHDTLEAFATNGQSPGRTS